MNSLGWPVQGRLIYGFEMLDVQDLALPLILALWRIDNTASHVNELAVLDLHDGQLWGESNLFYRGHFHKPTQGFPIGGMTQLFLYGGKVQFLPTNVKDIPVHLIIPSLSGQRMHATSTSDPFYRSDDLVQIRSRPKDFFDSEFLEFQHVIMRNDAPYKECR